MRKSLSFLFGVFTLGAMLLVSTTAQAGNLVGDKVVLRALDKVTATTKDYTVNIGEVLEYGSLEISVHHCEKKPPEETPETYVFLQIMDTRLDGSGEKGQAEKLFSGWMFASSPALSSLEHAVYDIWVIDCQIPKPIGKDGLQDLTDFEN